jgi:hypothetical protein
MCAPSSDLLDRAANVHIARFPGPLIVPDIIRIAVAEPAILTRAPAAHLPRLHQRTRVHAACRELLDQSPDLNLTGCWYYLVITQRFGAGVTKLPRCAFAPALDETAFHHGTGMLSTSLELPAT